ncbi:Flp pilus assembly protein CpaB [Sphingomonas alba]|uniref:Flp pilus assembly protein CpaB n=1 Tax=Sphingomonas alba TaxID=2908208 RepID=A0ABT0RPC3_9SPHN|nr:Flp pilus assembly protein CpaB [Sphingomonas alba]MCL6684501.1 Flp pilus assembly protein CpaB [Sphingomonas alba]
MRRQSLIALLVAILLGAVAVYLANVFLTNNEEKTQKALAGTTPVAVASAPLDYGVPVTAEKVKFVEYPNGSLPAGVFTKIDQVLPPGKPARIALRPIAVNEPILAGKISGTGQVASIAATLPPGMRAAAVRINDVSGVAGFVQPNDSVDVLVTRSVNDRDITDVLLQDVRVIAMDQNAKNADGTANIARTATLQVSPLDSQKLALAQQAGSLSLVLRKPGAEENNPVVETVSLEDLRYNLYGGARYAQANPSGAPIARSQVTVAAAPVAPRPVRRAPAPAKRKPAGTSIEIVRGTVGTDYKVGENGK